MMNKHEFIIREAPLNSINRFLDSSIYHCNFNIEKYTDALFLELNIHFPKSLQKASDKRKAEYLSGRYCAKKCLENLNIKNFTVKSDKNRCPIWPKSLKGSITHTQDTAISVVSSSPSVAGIGIDVESIVSEKTTNDIKEKIIYGYENSLLNMSSASQESIFSLIFSIKESFFKAAYPSTGYYFGFDAVRINHIDFHQKHFELTLLKDLNRLLVKGSTFTGQFELFNDHVLSILALEY